MEGLYRYIEYTNLDPCVTGKDIDKLVAEGKELSVFGVCVPPFWVRRASREIGHHDLQLITVIGFPLGYQMTEVKIEEAMLAIKDGANELDMVINISSFKDGMGWEKIELAKLATLAHKQEVLLKVIIEVAYLNEEETIRACKICADSGVDFVKTSTGFAKNGSVTTDHIKLIRGALSANVGIKASGGIREKGQALELIRAGADRLGTSSAKKILI